MLYTSEYKRIELKKYLKPCTNRSLWGSRPSRLHTWITEAWRGNIFSTMIMLMVPLHGNIGIWNPDGFLYIFWDQRTDLRICIRIHLDYFRTIWLFQIKFELRSKGSCGLIWSSNLWSLECKYLVQTRVDDGAGTWSFLLSALQQEFIHKYKHRSMNHQSYAYFFRTWMSMPKFNGDVHFSCSSHTWSSMTFS
jgi:hypothetical protein